MQELQGRVVGRNNDDARFLCKGLAVLHKEWDVLEAAAQKAQVRLGVDACRLESLFDGGCQEN